MLVIKAELWPGGDSSRPILLGVLVAANDGTGTATLGNYTALLQSRAPRDKKTPPRIIRGPSKLLGFRRKRFQVWYLITALLNQWGYDNPEAFSREHQNQPGVRTFRLPGQEKLPHVS